MPDDEFDENNLIDLLNRMPSEPPNYIWVSAKSAKDARDKLMELIDTINPRSAK